MMMCPDDRPKRRPNKAYYSDEHGYVCDCNRHHDDYDTLCPLCQERVDNEQEDDDDDT